MRRISCTIPRAVTSYDIEIQSGLLQDQKALLYHLKSFGKRFAIVTDDILVPLYGALIETFLLEGGCEAFLFSFPHGELNKTRKTKELLEDQLSQKKLGRDTCLLALGGGVVMDVGGYVAATYCRGISLILIPTSLLGMVDASIGGKTGVNLSSGKNMIGSLYQPKKVLIDPKTLQTLSIIEFKNGVVEMIKHGLIADLHFFGYLERERERILGLEDSTLEKAIFESCRIKKEIVEEDVAEIGKRRLVNFGHTFGHALEVLSEYIIPHGEAVALGLLFESYLSLQLGYLKQESFERIRRILVEYGLVLQLPFSLSFDTLFDAMVLDKKALKGRPRFVILNEIGSCLDFDSVYCTYIEDDLIKRALQWMQHDLYCDSRTNV